jgi:hypothetical protein
VPRATGATVRVAAVGTFLRRDGGGWSCERTRTGANPRTVARGTPGVTVERD